MNRSDRMQPVVNFVEGQEKGAAEAVGQARQQASEGDQRLADLLNYRQEYLLDFQRKGRAGVNGNALRQFQQFLSRLDEAIDQQRARLQGLQTQVDERAKNWQQKAMRAKAVGNATRQMQQEEQRVTDKQDQRVQDDRGSRAPVRR